MERPALGGAALFWGLSIATLAFGLALAAQADPSHAPPLEAFAACGGKTDGAPAPEAPPGQ